MLEKLRQLNESVKLFDIYSEEFSDYGRVINTIDVTDLIAEAKKLAMPESGSVYIPSVDAFSTAASAEKIKECIFGTLDTQIGYCHGYNNMLNAAEWHYSSELNVAVTPLVLILGKRSDIKDGRLDSRDMKAFYVPEGAAIEVYATSLHFCPCQVSDGGFGCIVGLPAATNTPLDAPVSDKLLFRKNKWIVAHEENAALIEKGVVPGIFGENYKINY